MLPLLLSCAVASALAAPPARLSATDLNQAAALREQALADETAWSVVSGLTSEVGQRLAGSANDLKARNWLMQRMRELGFDRVWSEPVSYPVWERGAQSAYVTAPEVRALNVAALGGSMGTPVGGVRGVVLRFDSLAALAAATPADIAGRIVFIDQRMSRARDGRGYGAVSTIRVTGASIAAAKGASAFLLRSAGSDPASNVPHTGMMRYDSTPTRIPAAALAAADADVLGALLAQGPVELKLELGARTRGEPYVGANVIGEITGREKPDEVVVIGGHLDSWDLGTGAIDDGAGVAITVAAAALIGQLPQAPRRSIRVVAWANEEQGVYGGKAYAAARTADASIGQQYLAAESDFGAGPIYAFDTGFGANGAGQGFADQLLPLLSPLGVVRGGSKASGGPDVGPLREAGVPVAGLKQDGTYYFDIHHTARDTIEQIDPAALKQNAAVWTVFAYLAAEYPGELR
jgi:Zn-dependent M28 family amino/carboxypeptidase